MGYPVLIKCVYITIKSDLVDRVIKTLFIVVSQNNLSMSFFFMCDQENVFSACIYNSIVLILDSYNQVTK